MAIAITSIRAPASTISVLDDLVAASRKLGLATDIVEQTSQRKQVRTRSATTKYKSIALPEAGIKGKGRKASPSSTSEASAEAKTSEEDITATHLEHIVSQFVEAINDRSFENHPSDEYLSEKFFAEAEYRPTTTTKQQHFDVLRNFLAAFPSYEKELRHAEAHVNLAAKYADVYAHIVVRNAPPGVERHWVAVFEFRKQKDKRWMCVKYTGLKNIEADGLVAEPLSGSETNSTSAGGTSPPVAAKAIGPEVKNVGE